MTESLRNYRVIVMPRAFDDIDVAVDYVSKQTHQGAVAVIDLISDACASLSHLPKRCTVYLPNRDPDRVVRSLPAPPFVIYFRVVESQSAVKVLTVRHGSRLQPKRFKR